MDETLYVAFFAWRQGTVRLEIASRAVKAGSVVSDFIQASSEVNQPIPDRGSGGCYG